MFRFKFFLFSIFSLFYGQNGIDMLKLSAQIKQDERYGFSD